MSSPYVGEIRMFGGNFAPVGWAFCDGSLLPIDQNDVLFNLIGTTYGGDGVNTFALPDLRSRVPIHVGPGYALGQPGGVETVTLTTSQLPSHSHPPLASSTGSVSSPTGATWAASLEHQFSNLPPSVAMYSGALMPAGGSQPHDNMLPFLAVNFILSLFGIYPSQS
ncbi:MAG: phage tail protein [Acidobacteriaceae bacterium]|nr:phage tail protein [Acidobacteriaceae bacterium]